MISSSQMGPNHKKEKEMEFMLNKGGKGDSSLNISQNSRFFILPTQIRVIRNSKLVFLPNEFITL